MPTKRTILGDAVSFQETAAFSCAVWRAASSSTRTPGRVPRGGGEIRAHLAAARQRLAAIDRELAEARHDVTVALALLEEETSAHRRDQRAAGSRS